MPTFCNLNRRIIQPSLREQQAYFSHSHVLQTYPPRITLQFGAKTAAKIKVVIVDSALSESTLDGRWRAYSYD